MSDKKSSGGGSKPPSPPPPPPIGHQEVKRGKTEPGVRRRVKG